VRGLLAGRSRRAPGGAHTDVRPGGAGESLPGATVGRPANQPCLFGPAFPLRDGAGHATEDRERHTADNRCRAAEGGGRARRGVNSGRALSMRPFPPDLRPAGGWQAAEAFPAARTRPAKATPVFAVR
jgi:hypothetical protein